MLERFERVQRIAAGVPGEQRRELGRIVFVESERGHELEQCRLVEHAEGDELDAVRLFQCASERLDRRVAFSRALREAPAQIGQTVGEHQALQHLQARAVGEMKVVDHDRRQPVGMGVAQ